jgi:t-SNARE complex subunit (syntaxin)
VIQVYRDRRPNDVEGANIEASALIQLGRMGEAKKILSEYVQDDVVKQNLERLVVSA